jgi:hypothetical protein
MQGEATRRHRRGSAWSAGAAVAVTALLAVRLLRFIARNAVNVLYYDQWEFWDGMFRGADAWTLFRWQHGPHRQGLGYAVTKLAAAVSGWDARFEALVAGGIVVVACALALALCRVARGRWSAFDFCVPLIVLTLGQFEIFVGTPNPAHGSVPLLLAVAYALAAHIPGTRLRLFALVSLGFLATYTGFGVFLGLLSPFVLALLLLEAVREGGAVRLHAAAVVASVLSFASFFVGYRFQPAVACFRFPDPHPFDYVRYLAAMYVRSLELYDLKFVRVALAVPVLLSAIAVPAWAAYAALRNGGPSRLHLSAFALAGFSILFGVNAAVGRVCLGPGQAASSRYVPYTVPMLLAAYLLLSSAPARRWTTSLLVLFAAACIAKEVRGLGSSARWVEYFSGGKQRWKACYLAREDVARCDAEARFPIYPSVDAAAAIGWKLRYLREHRLNLFKPGR